MLNECHELCETSYLSTSLPVISLITWLYSFVDLLSEFYYIMSDLELIADDSFTYWEEHSKNGIAAKSVTKFMTWLKTSELPSRHR